MHERTYGTAPRGLHLLAGVLAGLAGLAVSHLLTALLSLRVSPVVAVAESVIEITPGPVVETAIGLVGSWNKPLLVGGVVVGLLALSALAGMVSGRSRVAAALLFLVLGVVGLVAVVTRARFEPLDVTPVIAWTVTWIVALGVLTTRVPTAASATDDGRRGFLVTAGLVAAAAAVTGIAGALASSAGRGVEAVRRALDLPVTGGEVPAGATFDAPGLAPWQTPNAEFYRIDTALVVPEVDVDSWRLRIHGQVDDELVLSYADLLEREITEQWTTICCVSNVVGGSLIGNAWWSGVRVSDLLAEAGVQPDADAVLQTSIDGWNCGTPIEALTGEREAIIAIAMNGEPLPAEHGFPALMIVPGLYGYVSATKWLVDLDVTRFDLFDAYWTNRGWSERGPIKTQSRIGKPAPGAVVEAGDVVVGGYAWAQDLGIELVEYRLDGGPWRVAELARVPSTDTWVQWVGEVEVAPGEHVVTVRATDLAGETQTSVRTDVLPDGATGWHAVQFVAR